MKIDCHKLIVLLNLVLIVLVGCLLLRDNFPRHSRGFPHNPPRERMFDELGLSLGQQSRLKENREASRTRMESFMRATEEKRRAVAQQLSADEIDMKKVNALHGELKTLMNQLEDTQLQDILKVREILCQEKFRQFSARIGKMMPGGRPLIGMGKDGPKMPPPMEGNEDGFDNER